MADSDERRYRPAGAGSSDPAGFIPAHGGYQALRSYQKALIVYDATRCFCRRFIEKRDRTYDQNLETRPPEVRANITIGLVHQANYLLGQQLRALEMALLAGGRPARGHDAGAAGAA
jgi:hypothetical protein